ncbi:MAG: SRPBCC family protein [Actinoallomurus sp.]
MEPIRYSESIDVAATPAALYDLVSDIGRTGEWSPICKGCRWRDETERGEGAWFIGRNEAGGRTWETESQVAAAHRGREFAWLVGGAFARWAYSLTPISDGTRLTESWEFLPAGLTMFHEKYGPDAQAQIDTRMEQARTGIPITLAAIKKIAESP